MLIALVLSAVIIFVLVVSYICYHITFYNSKNNKRPHFLENSKFDNIRPLLTKIYQVSSKERFIEVSTKSFDGLTLRGRYYQFFSSAAIEIQFHGYKSDALKDLSGFLIMAKRHGHNVLLVDQRSHGDSEGKIITFGIKEHLDCLSWVNYVNEELKVNDIFLVGLSMGGATVLMTSAYDLKNVKGIIADSSYASVEKIIKVFIKTIYKMPVWLIYPFVKLGAFLFARINISKGNVLKIIKKAKYPIFISHGSLDSIVPIEMAKEIYQNIEVGKELLIVKDADHGLSMLMDFEKYELKLKNFFNKIERR